MKVLKTILFIVLALLVIYAGLSFAGPNSFDTERYTTIEAPPMLIHDQVNNLRNWENWSPWKKADPDMTIEYGSRTMGIGGSQSWKSEKMGGGNLEIIESSESEMKTKLNFDGWDGTSYGQWKFEDQGEGKTKVSWGMTSDSGIPFLFRGLMLMTGAKGKMEKDFDEGLAGIKALAEEMFQGVKSASVTAIDIPERNFIVNRSKVSIDKITSFFEENFPTMAGKMAEAGIEMQGMPSAIYFDWNSFEATTDMAAAIPVGPGAGLTGYESVILPEGKTLVIDHFGPYNTIAMGHFAMDHYIKANNLEYKGPVIEEYMNDPTTVSEDKIHTKITYYVK